MTDEGRFHCTECNFTTKNIFRILCPECGSALFLPIEENPEFHSQFGGDA